MGIYDELRNQNVKIRTKGNTDAARSHFGKVKKIIEQIQGSLELGVNEGFNKTQRVPLDDFSILDIQISPGVLTPMIQATITARAPEGERAVAVIKDLVLENCPPLPQGREGRRMFTQLMGDRSDTTEDQKNYQQIGAERFSWTLGTFINEALQTEYWRHSRVDLKDWEITYRGQEHKSVGLDFNGSVNFSGNRWSALGTNHVSGYCSNFSNLFASCFEVPYWCDSDNYIRIFSVAAYNGTIIGNAVLPSTAPWDAETLRVRGVRVGEAYQATNLKDEDGFTIMVRRRAVVFQRAGGKTTVFNTRLQANVDYIYPDGELVFLERDPFLSCPRAIGVFYNGSDGENLFPEYEQGDWSDGRLGTFEGINGWCDTFGTFTNTADVYDWAWYCQNALQLCPIFLGGVGVAPGVTHLSFVGAGNRSYIDATPQFQTDYGYATAAYCGRTFWFPQNSQGYIDRIILQDWRDGQEASEDDVYVDGQ